MLRFDANLFRITFGFSSKEETRYYLNGVFVEPHAVKGVIMAATDGHRLFCVRDEHGAADESAIIALSAEALRACKPAKVDDHREVSIEGNTATILAFATPRDSEESEAGIPVAFAANCRVEGTFPDYRRVIPEGRQVYNKDETPGYFNGAYLGDFGKAAGELEKHFAGGNVRATNVVRVIGREAGAPHVVLFQHTPNAFGLLMPVYGDNEKLTAPTWVFLKAGDIAPAIQPAEKPELQTAE